MNRKEEKDYLDKLNLLETQSMRTCMEIKANIASLEGAENMDEIDRSTIGADISRLKAVLFQSETRLKQVHAARERIKNKTFGLCISCDDEIPKNRLIANPLSLRCLACQEEQELIQREAKLKSRPSSFSNDPEEPKTED